MFEARDSASALHLALARHQIAAEDAVAGRGKPFPAVRRAQEVSFCSLVTTMNTTYKLCGRGRRTKRRMAGAGRVDHCASSGAKNYRLIGARCWSMCRGGVLSGGPERLLEAQSPESYL